MSTIPDRKTAKPRQLPGTDLLLADSRATGSSHKETGKLISRSEGTVWRRAADPIIADAIRRRREELAQEGSVA